MKTRNYILTCLLVLILACNKEPLGIEIKLSALTPLTGEKGTSYEESLNMWNEMKAKHGNSYLYQTHTSSWTGNRSTTEIKVIEGMVTERKYELVGPNAQGEIELIESFAETKSSLGSHPYGTPPVSIDSLYKTCGSEYLVVDTIENTLYFTTNPDGLMTSCGFWPTGCVDDCFSGVSLKSFDWLNQ